MRTLRTTGRTLLLSLALLAPAGAASAQTASYPGNPPEDGEVLGTGDQRGDAEVRGVVTARPETTSGAVGGNVGGNNLAVTGSDAAQLALIGVALVGGGVVLVKRTRRVPAA